MSVYIDVDGENNLDLTLHLKYTDFREFKEVIAKMIDEDLGFLYITQGDWEIDNDSYFIYLDEVIRAKGLDEDVIGKFLFSDYTFGEIDFDIVKKLYDIITDKPVEQEWAGVMQKFKLLLKHAIEVQKGLHWA